MPNSRKLYILIFSVVAVIVLSSFMAGFPQVANNSASLKGAPNGLGGSVSSKNLSGNLKYVSPKLNNSNTENRSATNWSSMRDTVLSKLNSLNIPSAAKLPPNYDVKPNSENGYIYLPSYTSAPAPMGIASYGISNSTGNLQPDGYNTQSFNASITMNSANEMYMDGDAVHTFSIQFNAVLNNVTLFGHRGYQYWTQNVVDYSTMTHQLTFIDNIWNFSSPTAVITGNEIHSGNGTAVPGVYYYDIGPSFTVNFPFTLDLYLTTANIGGYNTVFFNYTIINTASTGNISTHSGSFDRVEFNSTGANNAVKADPANFAVSGTTLTDTGYVPMDAELILGGAGGGSIAEFSNINATMTMKYIPMGGYSYRYIPSAYDVGSETGETSIGISEYYSGNVAHLNAGPSFVEGLWNISGNPGHATISGTLQPSNGFIFINAGNNIDNGTAQWSPTNPNGTFNFYLSPGNYSLEAMMSYHNPFYNASITLASNKVKNMGKIYLEPNVSAGIYTPLYAFSNSQLANLSASGDGKQGEPYKILGPTYYSKNGKTVPDKLSTVFAQVDDYLYPVFYGIMVSGTTANSTFEGFSSSGGSPAFQISYNTSLLAQLVETFGEVPTNYLQMVFYNSSGIVVTNNTLSGWFSSVTYTNFTAYNIPPVANLILWNTTNSLVEHNKFMSQGSAVLIYNNNATDSGNYVWNNSFSNYGIISAGSLFGYAPIGLIVASSGNTIYNNIFDTTIPVVSLEGKDGNLYTGLNVTYHNLFNITRESLRAYRNVDGCNLTGSAIPSTYQGGNYYYNYFGNGKQGYNGSGVGLAFNDQNLINGSINYANDSAPLTLYGYSVTVNDSGLTEVDGYFDINNAIYPTDSAGTQIYLPNGTYNLAGISLISKQVKFVPELYQGALANPTGDFVVNGPTVNMVVAYSVLYNLTVSETGLPAGTLWGFSIPEIDQGFISTKTNVSFYIAPGNEKKYDLLPQDPYGYYATDVPSFYVLHPGQIINISYQYSNSLVSSYIVLFKESGLPGGQSWSVDFNGTHYSSTTNTIEITNVTNGNYNYTISGIAGYNHIPDGVVSVNYSRSYVNVVFQKTSAIPLIGYVYIGVGTVAGIVMGALAVSYVLRRK
ncbi:thermopsin family protease [Oxyplasma meridianum]|uniref:Thermopsin family protease n=1 Tax=Oxyplasma meridianum TaxID=3073602 RepID=A0AAX4NF10_9ARCH